jgi:hypothetical protein
MLWHEKSGNPGDDKDQEVADFYRYQPPRKKSWNPFDAFRPGLPDGFFSDQKYQFWRTLEWKLLLLILVIWIILRPLGIFYGN